jgi:large subunit GTPase 1
MLSADKEKETLAKHKEFKSALTVPRRPPWDESTTAQALQKMEREGFLDWRRHLALLAERENLLLTPFERNLEVWRQLWRVIERSHLVVQIVDARNPLFFRSTDLETYVKEVDPRKKNLLLINKADYLTVKQRKRWADYFDSEGIRYTFFSAALAKERQEKELAQQAKMEALAQELAEMKAAKSDDTEEDEDEDDDGEAEADKETGSNVQANSAAQDATTVDVSSTSASKGKEKADEETGQDEENDDEDEDEEDEEDDDEDEEEKPNKTHSHWKAIKETEQDDERTRIRDTKDLYELLLKETPIIDGNDVTSWHGFIRAPAARLFLY